MATIEYTTTFGLRLEIEFSPNDVLNTWAITYVGNAKIKKQSSFKWLYKKLDATKDTDRIIDACLEYCFESLGSYDEIE